MLSKAQEWAAGEQKREARRQELRDEMMTLRGGFDAPCFTLGEKLTLRVTADGGCELERSVYGEQRLTADEMVNAARWVLETFT
jgi:hypothetical protein